MITICCICLNDIEVIENGIFQCEDCKKNYSNLAPRVVYHPKEEDPDISGDPFECVKYTRTRYNDEQS